MIKLVTQRIALITLALFSLSACMATDNPVPVDTLTQLEGEWLENDGSSRIQFYADETIKLTMPDESPPLRLLSVLEVIKDDQIGFGVGDRWNGPVHVVTAKDGLSLQLIFPGDPDRTLSYHPAK
ncbi:MAG: hypothetical protein COW18_05660 [Zetaproteobacteria bacterium CG12_big_fil_rev_8_21_14_0_65_54_13]|nr:MAG: hypothetical protein COX55_07965 [Zetaproteobacteria bacterium CG23_combo_of_CG06-09_8_20_14_all_54_7]PIW49335.1 MAG: hypothetical protein COW18_05660 [Zetaproteobacteria bacterium CG12_big_fil_rev_8_21_14_0_65_54_13]PIX54002.1 MAG: hypothetical protein COZ50_10290 [Zetaproteobacteria bacterium CG_4_10_14_3_um_filter_54_28]PJA29883.1 MAG: hypothetical protein CO188_05475 [Zetaproteobacteria bacterium CG_4_9_14_3_um_filter_54_145]